MNKKEKYINYIVDDLINNTEIDYEQERVKLPFFYSPLRLYFFPSFNSSHASVIFPRLLSSFSKHIKNIYGVRDEEIETIWDQYMERIQSLIKK